MKTTYISTTQFKGIIKICGACCESIIERDHVYATRKGTQRESIALCSLGCIVDHNNGTSYRSTVESYEGPNY